TCGPRPRDEPTGPAAQRRVHERTGGPMPDELAALRAVARDVARDPQTGWKQWAELGWLSLLVPEERGGAGADEHAAAVVARELGAAARREPFVGAGVLTTALLAGLPRTDALDELLESVMTGELLAVPAWQPESGALPGSGALLEPGELPGSRGSGRGVPLAVDLSGEDELTGTACWLPTAD